MDRPTIVIVSDSLTDEHPINYVARLRARFSGLEFVIEAHGGWSTESYFRPRLAHEAFARVPANAELCVILLGSNNLFEAEGGSDAAVAEATAGVVRIAEHVRTLAPRATEVLLVAPPTVALRYVAPEPLKLKRRVDQHSPACLGKLAASYEDLARRRGWGFVNLFPRLDDQDFIDAAHPNEGGHRKMAEAMAPAIESWLGRRRGNA